MKNTKETINDTTRFLLAGFKFQPDYLRSVTYLLGLGFKNCYLCKDYLYKPHIYLVFDYTYSKEFVLFNTNIRKNKGFIDVFHQDKKIIYILEYPIHFRSVYNYFICGKYSAFSPIYKSLFHKHYKKNNVVVESKIYKILHKDLSIKRESETKYNVTLSNNQEFYPLWNKELNIYDTTKF